MRPGEKFKVRNNKRKAEDVLMDASNNRVTDDQAGDDTDHAPAVGAVACVINKMTCNQMVIEATPMALRTPREAGHLLKWFDASCYH